MTGLVDLIQGVIGSFLYSMFGSLFLNIIDIVDNIFRALAGIGDGYQLNGNPAQGNNAFNTDGGLIYDLLRTTVIKKLIMAIMILAAFLLIIFTLMAFLKNVYAQKQKTSKEIISNSIKGALYFIFVPVCTLLGVYVGNIVLKAIDGATSLGGGQQMSSKLFIACAYNANKFRRDAQAPTAQNIADLRERAEGFKYEKDLSTISEGMDCYEFADIVDDVFAQSPNADYRLAYVDNFYHLYDLNHLLLIVGGVFILYVLCSLAFAMARRIFIILIWFAISPACCAMFPLDEGKMVGKYKDEMTKQVLSAYGAVAGINLFLSIMPLIDNLQIGSAWGASGFVNLFILISGLLCVKEIVSMLSSMVGGDDALAKGSSLMKQTTGAMKKYGGGAVKGVSKFTGKVASDVANRKHKGFLAGLGEGAWSTVKHAGLGLGKTATKGLFGVDIDETKKAFTDSKKAQDDAIGAKKAKKALDDFTDGLKKGGIEIDGINKTWTDYKSGAQGFADFLKEFQLRGGSKEEGVKLLARETGKSELDINRELAKFEKAKEVTSTVAAQAMPNILNVESEMQSFVESFKRATEAVDQFAADLKSGATRVATDSGTTADHTAFDAARTKIEAKDYAGAKVEIDKIDVSTLAEGSAFRGQVETVQNELAARETAQTEAAAAGDRLNGLLEGAASSVESVNAAAASDLRSAAAAIKGAASNMDTVSGTLANNMKKVRKTLK